MAASRAVTGNTATFSIGSSASPPIYTPMLEIKSIKPALLTVPQVPTTHLLSPNSTEEFIPGLIKPGTFTIMGNFIGDVTQAAILTLAEAQTVFSCKISGPLDKGIKAYTCIANGYISKYENGPFEQNKAVEFQLDVQITGTISETYV